ncbi:unnamed protein product [Rotaria sordida]|uniref:Uncharacterized protein n=1 Tax=Rotaria sordida TaxID=392033 RepID=A0A814R2S7_9BILA|nr:unnamed protein product [Rotaria sordida]
MFGLDTAGKRTMLYISKLAEVITTISTIGLNIETVSAVVFVVDSNDRDRIDEACNELHEMANEELLKNLSILIFANKQDLPNALTFDEIKEKLNLSKLDEMKSKWYLQPSIAITSAVIFVVDSNGRNRIDEACDELHEMANKELLKNLSILIFANKQDLPNALTFDEIKEKLNLSKLDEMKSKWYLQPSIAIVGESIHEGFE